MREMSETTGIPRKVRILATQMGMHADCLAAGPEKCCAPCIEYMTRALDHYYGHFSTQQAMMITVLNDYLADEDDFG